MASAAMNSSSVQVLLQLLLHVSGAVTLFGGLGSACDAWSDHHASPLLQGSSAGCMKMLSPATAWQLTEVELDLEV